MKKLLLLLLIPFFGLAQFNPVFFYQSSASKQFISTWNTANTSAGSSTSTQVKLPLISTGTYSMTVNWGDGNSDNISVWNAAATTHTYASSGTYTIKIVGICTGWQFNNAGDILKILSVQQWGNLRLGNAGSYFNGCANLNLSSVSDVLNLTGTTSFSNMFFGCSSLTTINRASEWNTSNITSLTSCFTNCVNFNQNIGAWNVSNVTSMIGTFRNCTVFNNGGNSSISSWDTSKVTAFGATNGGMFQNASAFNQPIGGWNTSLATTMNSMFNGASTFNQSISFDTSNVTDMSSMFASASSFNQALSFNAVKVTSFNQMFNGATNFNNGLASGVAGTMSWTINTTSNVDMALMFSACGKFNQNLSSWAMQKVTTLRGTFLSCVLFNNGGDSGIGSWNLASNTSLGLTGQNQGTFQNCTAFVQNIGSWNVSNVTDATNFMAGKTAATYSTANMDAIYNGWSALGGGVKPGVNISFGTAKYTAASSAGRAILTGAPNNWVITDGGI